MGPATSSQLRAAHQASYAGDVAAFLARAGVKASADNEVVVFLGRIGLQAYTATLLRNGWDDMETLLAITDADMKDAGLSSQHAAWLRAKLRELERRRAAGGGEGEEEEEGQPVAEFLRGIGLGQYAHVLLKNGWDEMDILLEIEDGDMKDLGMKPGHVLKLKKKLKEYQLQQPSQEQLRRAQSSNVSHRTPSASFTGIAAPVRAATGPSPLPAERSTFEDEPVKRVVAQSWQQVQQFGLPAVGELLCKNTLTLAPDVVSLFKIPEVVSPEGSILQPAALKHLFAKVVKFVGCAVSGRYDYPRLVETLKGLGADRATCRVRESHLEALGKALDVTLRQVLGGGSYTLEVQRAWMTAYNFMSSIMIDSFFAAGRGKPSGGDFSANMDGGADVFQFSVSGA